MELLLANDIDNVYDGTWSVVGYGTGITLAILMMLPCACTNYPP